MCFDVFGELRCKYIYIIWFGYLEVPESFSKRVLKYVTASQVTAPFHGSLPTSWGRMFYLGRSRPGDIDDGKTRMYGAIGSQNNMNKRVPRLETAQTVILWDTLTTAAEPARAQ